MKRGLKGWQIVQFARGLIRCRVFPDEEGTESGRRAFYVRCIPGLQSIPR